MSRFHPFLPLLLAVAGIGALTTPPLLAGPYQIYALPPLLSGPPFPPKVTVANGMSNVSGTGTLTAYLAGTSGQRAVRWTVTKVGSSVTIGPATDLGALPSDTTSIAYGVNVLGHVVGQSGGRQAFFWNAQATPPLTAFPPGHLVARAINDADVAAGLYTGGGPRPWQAFVGTTACTTLCTGDFVTLTGSDGEAINNNGLMTFVGEVPPGHNQVTVLETYVCSNPQSCIPLNYAPDTLVGAIPGEFGDPGQATPYGINDLQDIVGQSQGSAFVAWSAGPPVSLGFAGTAFDINNAQTIVGQRSIPPSSTRAFIGPLLTDPSTYNPQTGEGWTITDAKAINEIGWIAANGYLEDGTQRGLLLIPSSP